MIPFLDLRVTDETALLGYLKDVRRILEHGPIISGSEISKFEKEIARYCDRRFAVAVNSGTTSLFLALKAAGIKHGDEVIVPSLSWIATANAVALVGAVPIFSDITDELNICAKSASRLISNKTKAIIAVNFTGRIANFSALQSLASRYNLTLIEDAAQSFGAKRNNIPSGSNGDISCFSMNPVKLLPSFGEAGMCLTNDKDTYEKIKLLRDSGMKDRTTLVEPSFNCRMDTIQAAFLSRNLKSVDQRVKKRREHAEIYRSALRGDIVCPLEEPIEYHSYYTFTIQTQYRDDLREFLIGNGIETQIQHPKPMSRQTPYLGSRSEDTNCGNLVEKILSIPVHESLMPEQCEKVVLTINEFFRSGSWKNNMNN